MSNYSAFALLRNALSHNEHWPRAWRDPAPKRSYDVIIVGAGGHGLATAYYLAKNHGIRNVAVLEKGYLGGGNVGRNTTIVRSDYMYEGNTAFFEHSLKLWENLSQDLNYNVMFSQRGRVIVATSPTAMDRLARRANIMRLNGIDAELLDRSETERLLPYLDYSSKARWPIHGAFLQPRGGTARHDAVAWGYARAADRLGVDIIQNCEVTDFIWKGERVVGVETSRGRIEAGKVGLAMAGSTTRMSEKAGLKLPIESHVLQAFVSEPVKPLVHHVIGWTGELFYISQSDKGGLVFGGHLDGYNSWAQRGNLEKVHSVAECVMSLMPMAGRLRLVRHWGGIMDMTPDGSPFICPTPVDGLYLNAGWCYGGFKATPASGWCFAHTLATGRAHDLNQKMTLDRFQRGNEMDEHGVGNFNYKQ